MARWRNESDPSDADEIERLLGPMASGVIPPGFILPAPKGTRNLFGGHDDDLDDYDRMRDVDLDEDWL